MNRWQEPTSLDEAKRAAWDEDNWLFGVDHCVKMILRGLTPTEGMRILDFGCGPGRLLVPMRSRFHLARFYGYEPNTAMSRDVLDVWSWMEPSPIFGAVYSTLVFQHLNDIEVRYALADIARVLLSGGIFRLQYVNERADRGPLSNPRTEQEMATLCWQFGLSEVISDRDPIYPTWSWLTATKRGDIT